MGISQYLFSDQALRIKTKSYAAGSKVTNITYSVNIPLSLSQKLFLINIKGNYATGVREFGILIDQAGFQRIYYWSARVDLSFVDTELPKGSRNTWKGCNCFGRIASPVTILGYVTHDASQGREFRTTSHLN